MLINFNKKTKFNVLIKDYFEKAVVILKLENKLSCDIFFVSKRKIKKLNNDFRNINKVTDVLSFPSALKEGQTNMQQLDWEFAKLNSFNPETNTIFLGDIVLSLSKAKKQSKEYGHSVNREVCYLCVHGLLHLLGYDHMIEDEKKIMRKLEEELLKD